MWLRLQPGCGLHPLNALFMPPYSQTASGSPLPYTRLRLSDIWLPGRLGRANCVRAIRQNNGSETNVLRTILRTRVASKVVRRSRGNYHRLTMNTVFWKHFFPVSTDFLRWYQDDWLENYLYLKRPCCSRRLSKNSGSAYLGIPKARKIFSPSPTSGIRHRKTK